MEQRGSVVQIRLWNGFKFFEYQRRRGATGGGTSGGLLSFLKIGDRAAGAIKSGGTTRRAAKMVTLDLDHPDIEEYIDWKPSEEEKVSALVIGSSILQKHADSIMESIWSFGDDEGRFDQKINIDLKKGHGQGNKR